MLKRILKILMTAVLFMVLLANLGAESMKVDKKEIQVTGKVYLMGGEPFTYVGIQLGQALVSLYYTISPPIADFLARHENLRGMVRIALYPAVGFSHAVVKNPADTVLLSLSLLTFFGLILIKRRRG
jgi:hypothetical protein